MPIKPVEPHLVTTSHGKKRWCVIIPRALVGGKLKRRYFASKEKAVIYANNVEGMRRDCRNGYDMLHVQERSVIGRLLQKLGGSVDELGKAVDFYLTHNPKEVRTIPELVHEFIADRQRIGLSSKYVKPLRNSLLGFSLEFKNTAAQAVTAAAISQWLHSGNWEAGTILTHLKNVRALLNYALRRRYVAVNVAEQVERPKISRGSPGIFTVDEAERFMRSVERWDAGLIRYVALILFGGLRPEESSRCKPEFIRETVIDLPAGEAKNNRRRLVELRDLDTLRAWLAVAPDFSPVNLRKRMDFVRDATKIKGDPERAPSVKWCPDILRHSFVSYAVPIFGIAQTGLLADHSEAILKRHYRALVMRAEAEKFWNILPK